LEKLLRALNRHCLESRMFFAGQVEIRGNMDARGDPVSVGVPDPLLRPVHVDWSVMSKHMHSAM
jgi:hypothetical protein